MGTLKNHQSKTVTKMLLIGESGTGKTGAMASLVEAGYKLAIIDMDNGLDILAHMVPDDLQDQVHFVTCTDEMKSVAGKVLPKGTPQAWNKAMKFLSKWDDPEDPALHGVALSELDDSWIVVIDSLTFMGLAAMRQVLAMNGRLGQHPWQADWGVAMSMLEDMLALLYSDAFKPNVLVHSHVAYVESEQGGIGTRGLPMALGQKLPPKVPRYFNTVVLAKTSGTGPAAKKYIYTVSEGQVELKLPAPGKVPAKLPLESGLATIFKTLQGKS